MHYYYSKLIRLLWLLWVMAYQTFVGYFMPSPSLQKNIAVGNKGVHTFPKGISPKENLIA